MSVQGVRTERFGLFRVEQPVGQQWWDNPAPQAIPLPLKTIDQMPARLHEPYLAA